MPTFVENLNTRRLRRWLALLAACALVAACSFVRLSYDNFPSLARWEIDRYLGLDAAQEAIVDRHLEALQRWHRRDQLPQYGAFLREVDDELRTPPDPSQLHRWRERVRSAWDPVAARLAPGVAELALTLRPEQIERMRRRLAGKNDEFRAEQLPAEAGAREAARGERLVKRMKFLLGDLSEEQAVALRARAAKLPGGEEARLAEREARQQRVLALLERIRAERPPIERATAMARDVLATLWDSRDPRRGEQLARATAASDTVLASAVAAATPRQREHLSKLLRGYVQDAEALSGRALAGSDAPGSPAARSAAPMAVYGNGGFAFGTR